MGPPLALVALRPASPERCVLEARPDVHLARRALPWSEAALVSSWLDEDNAAYLAAHGTLRPGVIRPFLASAALAIVAPRRLMTPLMLEVPASGRAGMRAVVVCAERARFWSSVLDGIPRCVTGVAEGTDAEARAVVRLSGPTAGESGPSEAAPSVTGLRRDVVVDAQNAPHRVCIWLPDRPGGLRTPRVVYMLPGLGGHEHVRFQDRTIVDEVERWSAASGCDVVLVGVDASVPSGSEYVLATRETPWSRFLACDLPAAIEAQLGGLCPPDRRLLAGQSTGGFNALMLAMTHPGVFGTVVASSPDALDFEAWLLDARGRIRDEWLTWMRFEDLLGGEGAMRSYAHAWSSPSDGRVEWPACLDTGEVAADTLERWLRETPARLVETDSGRQALDALGGRLFIGCATQDEFDLFDPTVRFCRRLDGLAVRHECVVDSGSHFDVQARLARLLRRALDASLPAAGDP